MYRKVDLHGPLGLQAMSADAGSRTKVWVPDDSAFRFQMESCEIHETKVNRIKMTAHRTSGGTIVEPEMVNLFLISKGDHAVDDRWTRTKFQTGQMAVQVGWNRHESFNSGEVEMILFRVGRDRLAERGVDLEAGEVTFGPQRPTVSTHALHALASAVLREQSRPTAATVPRTVENAILELLVGLYLEARDYATGSEHLSSGLRERAMTLIRENYADNSLTPTLLAQRLSVSLRQLQRVFEASDTTVAAEIRRLRTTRAAALLRDPTYTRATITDIALLSGFSSTSELRRAVRRLYERTPAELRHS